MIIEGSHKDLKIIKKSSTDCSMFNRNILKDMYTSHTLSITFFGGKNTSFQVVFLNLGLYTIS